MNKFDSYSEEYKQKWHIAVDKFTDNLKVINSAPITNDYKVTVKEFENTTTVVVVDSKCVIIHQLDINEIGTRYHTSEFEFAKKSLAKEFFNLLLEQKEGNIYIDNY